MAKPPTPHTADRRTRWARPLAALAAVTTTLTLLLSAGLVTAADDPACERWPAFSKVEPTAGDIALVKVIESVDGVATRARLVDVLRGSSATRWKLGRLDPGMPRGSDCDGPPPLYADVGDRLVLAIDGTLAGRPGRVDSVALVTRKRQHPNRSGLERLTRTWAEAIDDERPRGARPLDRYPEPEPPSILDRISELFPETLRRLLEPVGHLVLVPWPERPPAPLPPGAEPLDLFVEDAAPLHPINEGWSCNEALWRGLLEVVDGELLPAKGHRVMWPRGFSARLIEGVGELVAPDGTVVAREGERLSAGGGGSPGSHPVFIACSVADIYYSPAS